MCTTNLRYNLSKAFKVYQAVNHLPRICCSKDSHEEEGISAAGVTERLLCSRGDPGLQTAAVQKKGSWPAHCSWSKMMD